MGAITWKVFHISSSNLLCMLLISSSWTSSIMAKKNSKWLIYCDFSHFTSIIWPCSLCKYYIVYHIIHVSILFNIPFISWVVIYVMTFVFTFFIIIRRRAIIECALVLVLSVWGSTLDVRIWRLLTSDFDVKVDPRADRLGQWVNVLCFLGDIQKRTH